jgi:hypothetical protein
MSIRSSIMRSKDDLMTVEKKSYVGIKLRVEKVKTEKYIGQNPSEDTRKRLYDREFSIDNAEYIFRISSKNGKNITVNQIRDLFDDIGFNTDVSFSEVHNSDIMMIYNLGGFLLPFYPKIINALFRRSPYRALFLTKLSPGKKRLHCRLYDTPEGYWYMTAHIDNANWMNMINPYIAVKSHLQDGTGDYRLGVMIMEKVFGKLIEKLEKGNTLFIDINKIYKRIRKNNDK